MAFVAACIAEIIYHIGAVPADVDTAGLYKRVPHAGGTLQHDGLAVSAASNPPACRLAGTHNFFESPGSVISKVNVIEVDKNLVIARVRS